MAGDGESRENPRSVAALCESFLVAVRLRYRTRKTRSQFAALRTVQSDVDAWPVPSLTLIRGTTLGQTDFNFYYPPPMVLKDGKAEPVVPAQWRSLTLEDQVDALLYLGPPSSIQMSRLPATLCADDTYLTMRLQRMALNPYGQRPT
jgi:hypothetical protein